jgi:hypothetical protein
MDKETPDNLRILRNMWLVTNWNTSNRLTANRHMNGYQCAVSDEVGCKSCCIYIAEMLILEYIPQKDEENQ